MPAFKFEALDAAGKSSTGLLEAENAKAARAQLRAQALVPLDVTPVLAGGAGSSAGHRFVRRVFDNTSLADATLSASKLGVLPPRRITCPSGLPAVAAMAERPSLVTARK